MIRKELIGICTKLRPINNTDIDYMVALRNKDFNKQFLSNRDQTISRESQSAWMDGRYEAADSVDFIIELLDGKRVGTEAIYDIDNEGIAEFGRYIIENPIAAIEGEYLGLKYAFEILGINKIYCKTVKRNTKVWQQHTQFGFAQEGEDFDERIQEARVIQYITKEMFAAFDYSKILNLLNRFK